jgi:hypothetical protein
LFEFGDKYRGKYDENMGVVKSYYASVSGYKDELLWGALWLYKATDNEKYLEYVINNAHCFGGTGWAMEEFSWDVKYAGLQIMAAKVKRHPITLICFKFKSWVYWLFGQGIFSNLYRILLMSSFKDEKTTIYFKKSHFYFSFFPSPPDLSVKLRVGVSPN